MIAVGYKIFAAILSRRLKDAGAEGQIWPTQFGFRSGCGCADALFISRRKVEKRKLASGPGLGQSFRFHFSYKFGQCNVAFRYSISFLFGGLRHLQWEAPHGARWSRPSGR